MNKTYSFFLIIAIGLLPMLLTAQANKVNPNGYNKFYYGNKQISSEGLMRNGKPDGYWKTYYVNGKMKSEGLRTNFELDSTWVFYDDKGNISKKISYKYGKKNGYCVEYKFVGDSVKLNTVVAKELYVNDLRQGISEYYYDDGKLFQQINFVDNQKQGKGIEYDKNGRIISLFKFRHDIMVAKERINRYNKQHEKQGTWKEFFPNGKLKQESYYRKGFLHGYVKTYNNKGKVLLSERYINGELYVEKPSDKTKVDFRKEYYKNGKLKTSGAFKENVKVGVHRDFSNDGKVVSAKTYSSSGWVMADGIVDKKGKRQGEWKYFFKSGKLKVIGSYKNGRRVGFWKFLYENGQEEQSGTYSKKGRPEGEWKWYFENGKLLRKEELTKGKLDGNYVEYDDNEAIVAKGLYVDGLKEGEWYYHLGDIIEEGNYKFDRKDGEWIHHYEDKEVQFIGSYLDGDENGVHKYFYQNGNIKMLGEYSMGKRHNQWKFFDEEGVLRTTITYRLGEEQKIDGKKIEKEKNRK
ncbi:MAG: hypothetical protein B6I20_08555 [Bacteroidetes bacterium 4572_117]|nr:MAG: hypothetical protein B6I20_08555 [Bacteroidetes bacterium 4572_117]